MILDIFGPILVKFLPIFDIFGQKVLKHWLRLQESHELFAGLTGRTMKIYESVTLVYCSDFIIVLINFKRKYLD